MLDQPKKHIYNNTGKESKEAQREIKELLLAAAYFVSHIFFREAYSEFQILDLHEKEKSKLRLINVSP